MNFETIFNQLLFHLGQCGFIKPEILEAIKPENMIIVPNEQINAAQLDLLIDISAQQSMILQRLANFESNYFKQPLEQVQQEHRNEKRIHRAAIVDYVKTLYGQLPEFLQQEDV